MSGFDKPRARLHGARVGAAVDAEQLAFGQGFRDGGTVNCNEVSFATRQLMDALRQRIFTCAGFSQEENIDIENGRIVHGRFDGRAIAKGHVRYKNVFAERRHRVVLRYCCHVRRAINLWAGTQLNRKA